MLGLSLSPYDLILIAPQDLFYRALARSVSDVAQASPLMLAGNWLEGFLGQGMINVWLFLDSNNSECRIIRTIS
jgi:hypothetical protein